MINKYPLLGRFVIGILLPLSLMGGAAVGYFRLSLPESKGEFQVDGLASAVSIVRDAQGVPHISARNEHDVFFAMGYVHAQDRLWQLELQRRFAQGRLSELFGRSSLEQDVWLRTLGLYEAARTDWPALGAPAQASLQAYADGINAWRNTHPHLPPEFAALGVTPEPWTVQDSLAWVKVFALDLAGNSNREIARSLAGQVLSPREMSSFFGPLDGSADERAALPAADPAARLTLLRLGEVQASLERSRGLGGQFVGSNAWVAGRKWTAGGGAMLANDPHLGLQLPSLWYPVVQSGGSLQSSGMSLVGLPLVIFGQNGRIAWGGTSMTADVQDLYVEQVNPRDSGAYRSANGWQRFTSRTESIKIRAEFPAALRETPKPQRLLVRSTAHGPVISDALGLPGPPVALRWTALDPGDTTYESFLNLNYAQDWASFRQALRWHVAPALNMLYADQSGNIGFQGVGRIPLRASGDGSLPSPGWNGDTVWKGYIPYAELPQSYNPERGYLVSANDKNVGPRYPYFISNDWAPPARALRIAQLIEGRQGAGSPLTVDDFKQMQADVVSLPAAGMLEVIRRVPGRSPRQREALAYFVKWNGDMGVDSQAAAIFNVWMKHLKRELFFDRLHSDWNHQGQSHYFDALIDAVPVSQLHAMLTSGEEIWCNADGHGALRSCTAVLERSLQQALDELGKLSGTDMRDWKWGNVHQTVYAHAPFSAVNGLKGWFERRIPSGGSADTINVANQVFVKSEGYIQTFGASFRQIVQIGGPQPAQLYMNSTGQSGNVFSPHYADMVRPLRDGLYYQLGPVVAPASTVTLRPHSAVPTREER